MTRPIFLSRAVPAVLATTLALAACTSSDTPSDTRLRYALEKQLIREMIQAQGAEADPAFSPKVSQLKLGDCRREGVILDCPATFRWEGKVQQNGQQRDIAYPFDGTLQLARIRDEWAVLHMRD